jgi:hypothetical protein
VGAVAGPVAASLLLARDPTGYGTVFAVGFLVSVVGLATFWLLVEPRRGPAGASVERLVPGIRRLFARPRFRSVLLVAGTLALVRPGDALLFLVVSREGGIAVERFPLLYSGASVVFLVAAVPFGRLADRIGRLPVVVLGEVLVAGALAVVASGARGSAALVVLLVLMGAAYAATDGVLMALGASVLPVRWRTTGLAAVALVLAGGRFVASSVYGALWGRVGGATAAAVFAVGAVGAVAVGLAVLRADGDRRDLVDLRDERNERDGSVPEEAAP